ncbi:cytochrome P450 [Halorussus ruber]|uniref:cytochrome P450 n=1 Tax=Halorussus ruber TaxID=1126238 RepID=UPI0010918F7F|nr:cytochrome P450 [Halorussus ruber]
MSSDDTPPPSPPGKPILGNLVEFSQSPFEYCREQARLGDIVEISLVGQSIYLLTEPEHVSRVLAGEPERFDKPEFVQSAFDPAIGESLLMSSGDEWQTQRETLQPAFYRDRMSEYASTIVETTARHIATWEVGSTVDITESMQRLTMRALVTTLFGDDVPIDQQTVRESIDHVVGRFGSVVSSMIPHWVPTPTNVRFVRALWSLEEVVDEVLVYGRTGDPDDQTLLSLLVAADRAERLSRETVRDEILMFLIEGYGTTSLALTYIWYELARNPETWRRLTDELDEVVAGDRPTPSEIRRLDVTERVVTEALRKYPPIYGIFRETTTDVTFGDWTVPEGSLLCLPQFVLHRDERFYDDPAAFRPERWAGDLEETLPEYAYFPFGGGPRHCIGSRFAMLEMKAMLATMANQWRFDLESEEELSLTMDLVARPEDPVRGTLVSRSS